MIPYFRGEYDFLSNFYPVNIELRGRTFPSVEHAYMSEKSHDEKFKDELTDSELPPGKAKKKGKKIELRKDWDEVKIEVMGYCLRQKFKQEPLRTKLLDTGDQNLQEGNWWNDRFWGVDLKINPNYGENHLGRLLMEIRNELKKGIL